MMSIRFLRRAVVFSLMTVLVSAFVQAQPPAGGGGGRGGGRGFGGPGGFGGGRGMTMDRARLLGIEQVRTELKIEEAQAATIDAALEAYREERNSSPRPDRDALSKMSEEEQTALREKGQKESEELSKKTDEVLNALMEPEQTKRLDQIALQLKLSTTVVATLKSDDLKAKLTLSDEQIAKLDEAEKAAAAEMTKMFEEMRAAGGGGGGGGGGNPGAGGGPGAGFQQMQEKMTAARTKATESAMAVLSDDQKKTLDELKGAKFELDMRALMGGRGGFGGPGGGQGGQGGGRPPRGGNAGGTRPPAE